MPSERSRKTMLLVTVREPRAIVNACLSGSSIGWSDRLGGTPQLSVPARRTQPEPIAEGGGMSRLDGGAIMGASLVLHAFAQVSDVGPMDNPREHKLRIRWV